MEKKKTSRVASIDAMRALTMMLMLFVNDIPSLKGVPHWLFHAAADEDMLGFSDTIFPAFLFCVGMSVPFAIDNRLKRGDSPFSVLSHILWRSFALIVMGLFIFNCATGSSCMSYLTYSLLMIAGFFLIWTDYNVSALKGKNTAGNILKIIGVVLLVGIIVWCDASGQHFEFGWWGILGLIGWSYLVTSLVYLICRRKKNWVIVAAVLSMLLCMLNNSSLIPQDWFARNLILPFVPGGWAEHAFCMSGLAASMMMRHYKSKEAHGRLIAVFLAIGVLMLVAGIQSHQYWIISKIQDTPTWLFFCLAIFFPLTAAFYWIFDIKGHISWTWLIAPAGSATLTCYLLPYIWYPLQSTMGLHLPEGWWYGIAGIIISLVYSLVIIQIVRWMKHVGIVVKL